MKKYLIIIFVLLGLNALSQDTTGVEPKTFFSLNVLNPGVQLEIGLSKSFSLDYDFNIGFIYLTYGYMGERIKPTVQHKLQFRMYYNQDERLERGKSISRYSANYFTMFGYYSPTRERTHQQIIDNLTALCFAWGMQRNYKSNIHIGLELGFGNVFNANAISGSQGFPFIDYKLGYTF